MKNKWLDSLIIKHFSPDICPHRLIADVQLSWGKVFLCSWVIVHINFAFIILAFFLAVSVFVGIF